jgi:hypothetical protein
LWLAIIHSLEGYLKYVLLRGCFARVFFHFLPRSVE